MLKKIPRPVIFLGLISFFNDIASEMLYPVMPIFLTQVLGAPVYIVGIIEGVAEGLSSSLKTVFGIWSDRLHRRKPFIFSGYLFSAFAKVLIAMAYSWPVIFAGRIFDRFGKSLRTGARDALLLEASSPNNKGFIFGFHRSMDSAGAVIGPLIAIVLLYLFKDNLRMILFAAAIPSFIALLFFIFIAETKRQTQSTKAKLSFSFGNLSPKLKHFLLVLAVFSLGNSSVTFLILKAKDMGMSLSMVLAAYVLYNFFYASFSTPAGKLADKIGAKRVFIVGLLIFSFVYFSFALNTSSLFVWFLFAVYGIYIAFTDGVSKALVGSLIDKESAGTAYGVMQTVISICTLLASVIGGFLWSTVSPNATFIFGAICSLSAFILFLSSGIKISSKA